MSCSECKFWDDRKNEFGECRRYAPKANVKSIGEDGGVLWPETHYDQWCGDFEGNQSYQDEAYENMQKLHYLQSLPLAWSEIRKNLDAAVKAVPRNYPF